MRWVAESIAEQRLLWHLRNQTTACLHYPDDLDEGQAVKILRQQLAAISTSIDSGWRLIRVLTVAAGRCRSCPVRTSWLYFFIFRIVGHYLSLRGASRGLNGVAGATSRVRR